MIKLLIPLCAMIVIAAFMILGRKDKVSKYTVCWTEHSEEKGEGHCRHNGVLTDSGWVFSDTVWSQKLQKKVVNTTWIMITKSSD